MDDLAFWRNIALVFIIIQVFVGVVIAVALSYLLVRLTATLHIKTENAARKAQEYSALAADKTDEYAEKVRKPVAEVNSRGTGIATTISTLFKGDQSQQNPTQPTNSPPTSEPGSRA